MRRIINFLILEGLFDQDHLNKFEITELFYPHRKKQS